MGDGAKSNMNSQLKKSGPANAADNEDQQNQPTKTTTTTISVIWAKGCQ
jgi:hypothetical protein